jgi:ABC-type multidrug transport system fused ATPase/permease subunit
MKKEFSFYEFVGILVPSTILLYSIHLIIETVYKEQFVDFGKIGETLIFVIICYGFGHLLQAFGNIFENVLWWIYGGKPTKWLTVKNRFGNNLFEEVLNLKIEEKVKQKFGDNIIDYGKLTYNVIFQKGKTTRIDIFNGNYSLFRGLVVSFFIISIMCMFFFNWKIITFSVILFFLAVIRMIRFAKHYAKETYRTFYNLDK